MARLHGRILSRLDQQQKFNQIRGAVEHEDNLINHRFSWLIIAQSFLLATWAYVYSQNNGGPATFALSIVGLSSALFTYVSIWAAIVALERLRRHPTAKDFQSEKCYPKLTSPPRWHWLGLFGPVIVPLFFIGVWCYAAAVSSKSWYMKWILPSYLAFGLFIFFVLWVLRRFRTTR